MTSRTTPIDVLYVINGLGTGGAERSLAELVGPLRERGVQVTILCLQHKPAGMEAQVVKTTNVEFIGPGHVKSLSRIRSEIIGSQPDIIHTTIFESDVLGRLASIGTNTPVVSSIVNTSYELPDGRHPDVSRQKLGLVRAVDGFTARHLVDKFHVLTEASGRAAIRTLRIREDSIEVIPRGRDTTRLGEATQERRQRVRSEMALSDHQHVMLSVGRQEHQKGQIHAIEATALAQRSYAETTLLIAGRDGAASGRLRAKAESEGIADRVRFLGHHEDIPDLMVAADVLLFPSLYEGFGGTVIEAMALGTPIVASDIPTLREVTAGAAILVPVGSSTALAQSAMQLRGQPELADKLRSAGLVRFHQSFTLAAVADQMAAFYRSVVVRAQKKGRKAH